MQMGLRRNTVQHKVTVVTPSYNQGRFIERTIVSVLSQQFPGSLEYFVMDGGSTDETVSVLQRFGGSVQWVSEKDAGQADAVNKGIARSTGDIIGWLNSDDVYYPGAVAAACRVLDEHPEVDFVYGDADHIDKEDRVIEPYPTEPWNPQRLLEVCYLCQPAVFFRKSATGRFGVLNPALQFCMDYEYWIRASTQGARFFWLREKLAGSRLYAETKTLGSRRACHTEINSMLRDALGRVPESWLINYAHAVADGQGVPRSDTVRFPLHIAARSLYASVHWNRRISISIARNVFRWCATAAMSAARRLVGPRSTPSA